MPSIGDFVDKRWVDAKEELRKLDNDFAKQLLPKKWHHLLETCMELTMRAWMVQVAATSLTAKETVGMSRFEAGVRADYHFRSWFIHMKALTECTNDVINKTTEVYIAKPTKRKKVANRHHKSVYQQITKSIDRQRNDYVHPRRSWASGITEDGLWERNVTMGMTPAQFLREFHYPVEGNDLMTGKYNNFVIATEEVLDCIGAILQEFEADLAGFGN